MRTFAPLNPRPQAVLTGFVGAPPPSPNHLGFILGFFYGAQQPQGSIMTTLPKAQRCDPPNRPSQAHQLTTASAILPQLETRAPQRKERSSGGFEHRGTGAGAHKNLQAWPGGSCGGGGGGGATLSFLLP